MSGTKAESDSVSPSPVEGTGVRAARRDQVRFLYASLRAPLAVSLVVALCLAAVQYRVVSPAALLAWLCGFHAVAAARFALGAAWRRSAGEPVERWLARYRIGALAAGLAWAGGITVLFPADDIAHQVFLAFAIAGVTAGGAASMAADRLSLAGYAGPPLATLIAQFVVSGGANNLIMGAMLALYSGFMASNALSAGRWLGEISRLRRDSTLHADRLSATERERDATADALEARQREAAHQSNILKTVLANMGDGITVFDSDFRLVAVNQRCVDLIGIPAALARPGVHLRELLLAQAKAGEFGPCDPEAEADRRLHALWPDRPIVVERSRPDGRTFEMRRNPIPGGGFVTIYVDVTRRKEEEQALKDVNAVLEQQATERGGNLLDAVESIEHALLLYDSHDRIIVFNRQFIDQYREIADLIRVGVSFEEMFRAAIARGTIPVPAGQDAEAFIADRLAAHRRADGTVIVRQLADGRILHVSERRARNGGVISIGIDMTDRLRTEHQLREAQKLEAIGKLTGGMAHDFNNYLGVIVGNLDLLAERVAGDPQAAGLVEATLAGALRGAELTRSLLAYSRRQPLDPRVVDLNQRLASITDLLRRTIGEDIVLDTRLAPDLWSVRIDGAQLDSCIVNLANNARDAMPRGGRLTITSRNQEVDELSAHAIGDIQPGRYVRIDVSDTGGGMPPDTVARAFEPFFTTKGPSHGTGLGLSMVYGFVKQSGGQIWIESQVGHGTTVTLYLPHHAAQEATGPHAAATRRDPLPGGCETILLVEDNDQVRRTAAAQLVSLGYRVIEARSGAEAAAILARPEPPIDLLFSDVVMPGPCDGTALARLAPISRPGIRVLLTSGFPGDLHGKGAPEAPLLDKPYRKDELARAVRDALDGTLARVARPTRHRLVGAASPA